MEDPCPNGEQRTFQRRKILSTEGWPVKVSTKLDDSWALHWPLRRMMGGLQVGDRSAGGRFEWSG